MNLIKLRLLRKGKTRNLPTRGKNIGTHPVVQSSQVQLPILV